MVDDEVYEILMANPNFKRLCWTYLFSTSHENQKILEDIRLEIQNQIRPESRDFYRQKFGDLGYYEAAIASDQAIVFNEKIRRALDLLAKIAEKF